MEMTKSKCRSTKEFLKPNDEQDVDLVLISLGFVTPFVIRYSCFVIANQLIFNLRAARDPTRTGTTDKTSLAMNISRRLRASASGHPCGCCVQSARVSRARSLSQSVFHRANRSRRLGHCFFVEMPGGFDRAARTIDRVAVD